MSHVFISYSTKNADYAGQLADNLRARGFDVWIDNAKLRSSDNWWEKIVLALKSAAAVIVVMTPESRASKWVQREVTLADNWSKPTFPLLVDGDNWEIFVLTQFEDLRGDKLPSSTFYDSLQQYAPRQSRPGSDVTEQPSTAAVPIDTDVRIEIANPPPQDAPDRHAQQTVYAPLSEHIPWGMSAPLPGANRGEVGQLQPGQQPELKRFPLAGLAVTGVVVAVVVIVGLLLLNNQPPPQDTVSTPTDASSPDSQTPAIEASDSTPIAAFVMDKSAGDAPFTIQITNQSSGYITAYAWDFGDGGTSSEINPSHTYQFPGTYTVILTATGTGGSNSTQSTVTVNKSVTLSGLDGVIAFETYRDGNAEIYVMDADGGNLRNLTQNPEPDFNPALSWDGSWIAFQRGLTENAEIYVMETNGVIVRRLTENSAFDSFIAWSPDDTKIAFTSYLNGKDAEIYVMNADGTGQPLNLTNNPAGDFFPSWSPDGSQIAFHSDRDGNPEIYVMNAGGSDPRRLTQNSAEDYVAVWSPDSGRIAFESYQDGNAEIYTMDADGSHPHNLTQNSADDKYPAWSPDGTQLTFYSTRDGNDEIYVMNADGSAPRNLTNNAASDRNPSWRPAPQS